MGEFVILYRPGILVVSGCITAIDKNNDIITIENYSSVAKEKRTCRILCQNKEAKRPDMFVGSFILATVKSTQQLATLATGGNDGTKVYDTAAYNIRYSGSFDFLPRGIEKEKHVFMGNILSSYKGHNGYWFTIGWNRMNKRESRVLYADIAIGEIINQYLVSEENTSRLIFVTSELKKSYQGSYYVIERVCC